MGPLTQLKHMDARGPEPKCLVYTTNYSISIVLPFFPLPPPLPTLLPLATFTPFLNIPKPNNRPFHLIQHLEHSKWKYTPLSTSLVVASWPHHPPLPQPLLKKSSSFTKLSYYNFFISCLPITISLHTSSIMLAFAGITWPIF